MPLRVTLKPKERLFINGAVVVNDEQGRINLVIANDVPILREKDILTEQMADTHCKRIYLSIQLMYMDEKNLESYQKKYSQLVEEAIKAAPSTIPLIRNMSEKILTGDYYKALKLGQKLIHYESELIHAGKPSV